MIEYHYNDDCNNMGPLLTSEHPIDERVDEMDALSVTDFALNVNTMKTNYPSKVWGFYGAGYDPDGPDDQPRLSIASEERVRYTLSNTR